MVWTNEVIGLTGKPATFRPEKTEMNNCKGPTVGLAQVIPLLQHMSKRYVSKFQRSSDMLQEIDLDTGFEAVVYSGQVSRGLAMLLLAKIFSTSNGYWYVR